MAASSICSVALLARMYAVYVSANGASSGRPKIATPNSLAMRGGVMLFAPLYVAACEKRLSSSLSSEAA